MRSKVKNLFIVLGIVSLLIFITLALFNYFKPKGSGILIETEPVSTIYVDGIMVGKTPYEATRGPGEIFIQLKPEGELPDYQTKVNLVTGVKTIIKRTFNADEQLSSGAVVSFEKLASKEPVVSIVSVPDNSQIFLDNRAYGFTPFRTKVAEGDHQLLISSPGYLDKLLQVRAYKGYKLTAVVKLAKNTKNDQVENKTGDEEDKLGQIEILETDTGFLRVRENPNSKSEILGQVNPGETYEILEISDDNLWYKIEIELIVYGEDGGLPTKIQGWVSGEYAKVIED